MHTKHPVMVLDKPELLPHTIGSQARFFAQSNSISPTVFLGMSRIIIPEDLSWSDLDHRIKHQVFFSPTKKTSALKNGKFEIEFLEEILSYLPETHPIFRPSDFLDWPFIFAAQLSFAAQIAGTSPKELFRIFCIDFVGTNRNSWEEFAWHEDLEPIWVEMELKKGGEDHARLQ